MIQRDYIERMIQQVAQALAMMLRLRNQGELGEALRSAQETEALVLGPEHQLLARMEATTLVELIGRSEVGRVRLYAALVAEEGATYEMAGDGERAVRRFVRALELFAAASLAGARLDEGDRERIAGLAGKVDVAGLDPRYRDVVSRLAAPER